MSCFYQMKVTLKSKEWFLVKWEDFMIKLRITWHKLTLVWIMKITKGMVMFLCRFSDQEQFELHSYHSIFRLDWVCSWGECQFRNMLAGCCYMWIQCIKYKWNCTHHQRRDFHHHIEHWRWDHHHRFIDRHYRHPSHHTHFDIHIDCFEEP